MGHNNETYKLHWHEEERAVLDCALNYIVGGGSFVRFSPPNNNAKGYALKLQRFVSSYETQMRQDQEKYKYSLLIIGVHGDLVEIKDASKFEMPVMVDENGNTIGDD
jgi:hypothetical protein